MEHLDVVVVGAGLAGIGAAHRLRTRCPRLEFAILEGRDAIGGTWDLFRYPGVRSDSDMFTLGYPFRPWRGAKAIADGPSILQYVLDTAREGGVEGKVRFGHRVVAARWSSADARWEVEAETATGKALFTCRFLYLCSGYYSYESGYTPDFPGLEEFGGRVVHPQHWPSGLDYAGRRVVVIGSGATAVTLVPAMAETAAHVTMLQRSPSYVLSLPGVDKVADGLRSALPGRAGHAAVRWKNVLVSLGFYKFCRRFPRLAAAGLRRRVARMLPASVPVRPHFAPSYDPWDQRLCLVPDADLFRALRGGRADVVTGRIAAFTPGGIRLESGAELPADLVVTATGLRMVPAGGIALEVDGEPVHLPDTLVYKGLMLSGVPNLALCLGYTNASWTLRADLSSLYVCRILRHLDRHGLAAATPRARSVVSRPLLGLTSGYVRRASEAFPRQGARGPWALRQNYPLDFLHLKLGRIDDGVLEFTAR